MSTDNQYKCPKCDGHLRVGDYIIFIAKSKSKQKGLMLLHPQIGNYLSITHPEFIYDKGDCLDFYCPMCQASLSSDIHENLIRVILLEKDGKEYDVYFSRIAGEQSTYKVNGDNVYATGKDADRYTHFRLEDKLKKYL